MLVPKPTARLAEIIEAKLAHGRVLVIVVYAAFRELLAAFLRSTRNMQVTTQQAADAQASVGLGLGLGMLGKARA